MPTPIVNSYESHESSDHYDIYCSGSITNFSSFPSGTSFSAVATVQKDSTGATYTMKVSVNSSGGFTQFSIRGPSNGRESLLYVTVTASKSGYLSSTGRG